MKDFIAQLDPAVSQAIATISGAVAMLIISIASYYFPKDRDRFDAKRDNDDDDDDDTDDDDKPKHKHVKK